MKRDRARRRRGQPPRSVTLKVAPVQASLYGAEGPRGKRGNDRSARDGKGRRGLERRRERQARLFYRTRRSHTTNREYQTTPSRLCALPRGREPDLSGSPVIHGHVHIIISRGKPRDSRRGSTDRECHSASGLFAPLPLALFRETRQASLPVAAAISSSLSCSFVFF